MTGRPSPAPARTLAAWQQALGAEHAAIFGYGRLGPRLDAAGRALARACQRAHLAQRDATMTELAARGADPVRSLAGYPLPDRVESVAAARRLALNLEEAAATAWRFLLATAAAEPAAAAEVRRAAITTLSATAVRAMRWRVLVDPGAPTVPFPGL